MAVIADGIGSKFSPTDLIGGREPIAPPASKARVARYVAPVAATGSVIGNQGLGRLSAAREHRFAAASQTRRTDRHLGDVVKLLGDTRNRLDQVKLYPPYPPNESRRAAAIREFNGIAAEVRRLAAEGVVQGVDLTDLGAEASTAEVERAVAELSEAVVAVSSQRAARTTPAVTAGDAAAAGQSAEVGRALAEAGQGLTRGGGDLLRGL